MGKEFLIRKGFERLASHLVFSPMISAWPLHVMLEAQWNVSLMGLSESGSLCLFCPFGAAAFQHGAMLLKRMISYKQKAAI